jgi:hypothetical protein
VLERIMRDIRRRTHVVSNFPDGNYPVTLVSVMVSCGTATVLAKYVRAEVVTMGSVAASSR